MEDAFNSYSSIISGYLQWKCIVINGNVHNKLILHYENNDNTKVYIDNDFGEYMLCSTYRIDPNQREEIISVNNRTVSYRGLVPFSYNPKNENKNTVMVRRIPTTINKEEINFVDSQHMSRDDVIRVSIPPMNGFENMEFSGIFIIIVIINTLTSYLIIIYIIVYSPFAPKLSDPIREFKGQIFLNAKAMLPGNVFEQHIDLALEVEQVEVVSKKSGTYDADGNEIILPYVVNVTVLYVITRSEFDMIKFFNPNTTPIKFMTIYGEAKVANFLEAPTIEKNGQQQLFFSSSSYLFLKICKNKNIAQNPVQSTSELPRSDGKECYRSEIEVMAAIKKGIDNVSCAGSDRIVLFTDVVSDADNVYVVLPFKKGLDANSKLNNYNAQMNSINSGLKTTKSDYVCKILLKNVSTAICFLHSLGISHNDIKLENIVSSAPLDAPILDWVNNLSIVDFGQARRHCINQSNSMVYPLPWLGFPGTPNYYCPETLQSTPYDGFKVDVFQLAMTIVYFQSSKLYEKFRKNFDEYKEFLARLKAFGPEHFVALFGFSDPVLISLLVRMLNSDPNKRISMKEVREQSAL